ncbi:zinc finger CCCH domain-containing protein 10-like [Dendronephthya gigantea]|uniref:zinc finger CCCH domain-containing protein 10-like n=1 Tax=Dendronephthya gigantea TaxID=151771 RepID=UPI00106D56ED|nr:zinc finger CCCH domain-containing protein 10-like [Dendronephthya gigantea]XP_028397359.1 zinc finger CCCH domain-containing protein 10-like [Dendronephthya gigantea]
MEGEKTDANVEKSDEQICRDFQRGVCSRGDKCKFAHPSGMGSEPKDQPMICRDFQNGTCNRSTCKYLHVTNQEEKDFMRTGQLPPGHPRGVRGRDSNVPICKDFLNHKCNRGSGCKFRHIPEDMYGGGGGYYDEPPRKRPRDAMDNDYRYLMEENVSLRRKVSELQKDVSDLRATNDILLEQNARYRRSGGGAAPSYGGGYGTDSYSGSASSVSYPSRDSYAGAGSYNAYASAKPAGTTGYDGYTKFE